MQQFRDVYHLAIAPAGDEYRFRVSGSLIFSVQFQTVGPARNHTRRDHGGITVLINDSTFPTRHGAKKHRAAAQKVRPIECPDVFRADWTALPLNRMRKGTEWEKRAAGRPSRAADQAPHDDRPTTHSLLTQPVDPPRTVSAVLLHRGAVGRRVVRGRSLVVRRRVVRGRTVGRGVVGRRRVVDRHVVHGLVVDRRRVVNRHVVHGLVVDRSVVHGRMVDRSVVHGHVMGRRVVDRRARRGHVMGRRAVELQHPQGFAVRQQADGLTLKIGYAEHFGSLSVE
ncbi:hypothetical protein ACFW17_08475 [Streptomyces sp. NPDC058961]|uniref:hypothetical protein n=1 Tax=Streptomyces sp. NPDC058961 TaxID=3346680 RepID=UPI0036B85120